jgi:hypothetical protein
MHHPSCSNVCKYAMISMRSEFRVKWAKLNFAVLPIQDNFTRQPARLVQRVFDIQIIRLKKDTGLDNSNKLYCIARFTRRADN